MFKMKECEIYSNLKIPCSSKVVIRADGRNFQRLAKELDLKKPYDKTFSTLMASVGVDVFQEFSPIMVYTFSDEINILLGEIPFAGRVEKIDSVFAGFISSSFTQKLMMKNLDSDELSGPLSFDSRIIPLSSEMVVKYFQERQSEAWRNCLNGYAYWTLRKEHSYQKTVQILRKQKSKDLHDLLFKRGININEVPSWQRRGLGIYRRDVEVEGYNPLKEKKVVSIREKAFVDWELPLFDPEFFKGLKKLK
ncbi:tRNA(His) guanylyltransferase Thg1 family protein [Methanobacterium sp. CWC-01]|uniref:tRNA(His) guanylyltransferase Thg1 family protein n=1 Tax=Methanobacterium aridiramus TaxID=2584467 RepID=UPI003369E18A